ncbi:unnamed protein product [Moneuplotes crassus]|uniref:Uncharacterized protein n=1 Tax=Euplotes crassus TaxID=5936 RepID=A0AAD1UC22_EUPCR|nr:unnamed protein product [Moneuplotes crassus]
MAYTFCIGIDQEIEDFDEELNQIMNEEDENNRDCDETQDAMIIINNGTIAGDNSRNLQSVMSLSRFTSDIFQGGDKLKDSTVLSPRENKKLLELLGEKQQSTNNAKDNTKGPQFYPKPEEDETSIKTEEKHENQNSLLMTLGNDELNWLMKELASGNNDVSSGLVGDTINDWENEANQAYGREPYDMGDAEESMTELENEILKQMNLSTN